MIRVFPSACKRLTSAKLITAAVQKIILCAHSKNLLSECRVLSEKLKPKVDINSTPDRTSNAQIYFKVLRRFCC